MTGQPAIERSPASRDKTVLRLWLRMLPIVSMVEQHLRRRFRETFGVTLPQFDVLAELDRAAEPQTMTALSRQLLVSSGNVTGLVDRLVRDGFVVRQPSRTDRRVQLVTLGDRGRREFRAMAEAHARWLAELFDGLSEPEIERLNELLAHAKSALRERMAAEAES